jgi:hypothetical protein
VLEKEALFERVLATSGSGRRRSFAGWLVSAGLAAACAAGLLVFARTRNPDEFSARGMAEQGPSVDIICVETGAARRCRAGGTLAFDVRASEADWYFAAFSVRDNQVVWFFPAEGEESVRVEGGGKPSLLKDGIRLTDHMTPGTHEVFMVFSRVALRRKDIKAKLGDDLRGREGIEVVRQSFLVEPPP